MTGLGARAAARPVTWHELADDSIFRLLSTGADLRPLASGAPRGRGRSQVDLELVDPCAVSSDATTPERRQHVLLPRLAERQPIERQRVLQPGPPVHVATQGEGHDPALELGVAGVDPVGRQVAQVAIIFCRGGFEDRVPGVCGLSGRMRPDRWAAATFLRIAWPLYRSTRPSRCSKSTGLPGRFQWTIEWHHQWKSMPSCPTEVVASTNGQNGELKAALTSGSRDSSWL